MLAARRSGLLALALLGAGALVVLFLGRGFPGGGGEAAPSRVEPPSPPPPPPPAGRQPAERVGGVREPIPARAAASAAAGSVSSGPAPADEAGGIEGTIRDVAGQPVADHVLFFRERKPDASGQGHRAVSNWDGRYEIPAVAAGSYRAFYVGERNGYRHGFADGSCPGRPLEELVVEAARTTRFDVQLAGSRTLRGIFRCEAGDLELELRRKYAPEQVVDRLRLSHFRMRDEPAAAEPDAEEGAAPPRFPPGYFEFTDLPAEEFLLRVGPQLTFVTAQGSQTYVAFVSRGVSLVQSDADLGEEWFVLQDFDTLDTEFVPVEEDVVGLQ